MALTKEKKKEVVSNLKEKINRQKIMIFAGFKNLKNKDLTELRKELRSASSELTVAKKTLLNLAFKEKDIEVDRETLKGENAIIFGFEDQVAAAKSVFSFAKNNPSFEIKGGVLEGNFRSAEDIIALAQLPSREMVVGQLVGTVAFPITGLFGALNGNIRNLINTLKQIKN